MKALISPIESVNSGFRVCQVQEVEFEVAEPYFWIEVTSDVSTGTHFYDPVTNTVATIPAPNFISQQAASNQPAATGVQVL